jgi:hypothetical protein
MEAYVNQDANDEAWSQIRPNDYIDSWGNINMPDILSTTETILQNYFLDRMKPQDIAERHYKSKQYVYYVIHKYTKIISQNIKKSVKNG